MPWSGPGAAPASLRGCLPVPRELSGSARALVWLSPSLCAEVRDRGLESRVRGPTHPRHGDWSAGPSPMPCGCRCHCPHLALAVLWTLAALTLYTEAETSPRRWLSWLEHHCCTPRLQVRSQGRAHTMNAEISEQTTNQCFPLLSVPSLSKINRKLYVKTNKKDR